jgi:hypothetical protein
VRGIDDPEAVMRCYFLKAGHIASVEELSGLSDDEAVEKSIDMFAARKTAFSYDGFDVWEHSRMILQYPAPDEFPESRSAEVIQFKKPD